MGPSATSWPAAADAMAGAIERQPADLDASRRCRSGAAAPQHRIDARQQLARRERLGDVVVGAAIEAGDLVALGGARRQHDHRQVARVATRA